MAVSLTALVGATVINKNATGGYVEAAVARFKSGGGFSNIFATPPYQQTAVAGYLANFSSVYPSYPGPFPNGTYGVGLYNNGGRGYPDVSAVGDNVVIVNNGVPQLVGGTSASAPTFAALINRINDARLLSGKKSLGFINPALYMNPQMFRDITTGDNRACGSGNDTGFVTSQGWDPVTGLGTPNYPIMFEVLSNL